MEALTWYQGAWLRGNPPIMGPMTQSVWLGSLVFDGARAVDGLTPDLDRHCDRVIDSARALGLEPHLTSGEIQELALEAVGRFPREVALYIRPMFWAEGGWVAPDPATTCFCLTLFPVPLPPPTGFTACMSTYVRPAPHSAPTDAKAAALYAQAGRTLADARRRGFDNAVVCDLLGNVAEFATANLFLVRHGRVATPVPNGCFLDGITRQRVIALLRADGIPVDERTIRPEELGAAEEIFATGNWGKVQGVRRFENRDMPPGPITRRAGELYWAFARQCG